MYLLVMDQQPLPGYAPLGAQLALDLAGCELLANVKKIGREHDLGQYRFRLILAMDHEMDE